MKRFGLIGKTLKHSFSKGFFEKKFSEQRITDCRYDNFELPSIDEFPNLIANNPELKGLNVTIPYKEEVLQFLNFKNEIIEAIGACNCIKIIDGKLHGFNTDAVAFKTSLQKYLKPHHKCALVLGTGGASKAVQYALKQLRIDFVIVSRHKKENQLGYEDVGEHTISDHQIIINTTPLGMYPNVDQDPALPYSALSSQHLLYDLTYNPPKTKFLLQGEAKGAQIINGYEMLVAQAEESWRIWNSD
ncbi:MAG TPA: shikimate dehydrogenase [Flavisolibacter sp.]|jgi:shikimate dehydrogenase|nr:shikimate dehydrogenase [Flavisolibacter sp.]